jgi:hypothetical protein
MMSNVERDHRLWFTGCNLQSQAEGAAARGGAMGKVAWGFTCSIDGFIAGPGHDMSWLSASDPSAEGTTEGMASKVAVIISGRRGYDAAKDAGRRAR